MSESYLERAEAQLRAGDMQSAQALALLSIAESLEGRRPANLPPAGAGDPRDPNVTHTRCRRCDLPTQWGVCPYCQPVKFARLP